MPVFTAIAAGIAAIAGAVGFSAAVATTIGAVGAFAARTLLTIGISKLLSNRSGDQAAGTQDSGSRVPLAPASSNSLCPVYGSAYISHTVVDAKISTDQKTMWYVLAMAEVTDTTAGSAYTFDEIYYGNRLVTFDGTDPAKVASLTTNTTATGASQIDTKVAGKIFMYLFPNGSSSGINTGGQTAIQIMSDAAIPSNLRWDSSLYTTGGQSAQMTNCAFVIVKVIYDTNAGTNTGLQEVKVKLTNTLYQPGSVIKDYFINPRYGCGLTIDAIDTDSLDALNTYSSQQIEYYNNGSPAYQDRYKINGPVATGQNCLSNLQQLVDSCDSWLQYSELTSKWKVVMNKAYDQTPNATSFGNLFLIDSSILIGGIDVNPIDLNNTYNVLQVQHPNSDVLDQTAYPIINLIDYQPELMSYNEPVNQLTIQYALVNNHIQAVYLGIRRMLQSREDLVISCALDYSGIQIEAGDVVRVTLAEYGWTEKLFRVSQVQEAKLENGTLGARITAFEYNESVYVDDPLENFIPEPNTGLGQTGVLGIPNAPLAILNTTNTISQMHIEGTVPTYSTDYPGQILYMDFNYGGTSNSAQHVYYTTVNASNGQPLTNGANVSINVTDIATGDIYWSVTARNDLVGVRGPSTSSSLPWIGPTVTSYNSGTGTGGITGNNVKANTISSTNMTLTGVTAGSYTNTNLTVDSAGRITLAANGTGGGGGGPTGSMAEYILGPEDSGGITNQSWDRNTTYPLKDISLGIGSGTGIGYLPGTTVSSSYYYPYIQGTSDTANLFISNSTAALATTPYLDSLSGPTPPGAGIQGPLYPNYSGSAPNLGGWALLTSVKMNPYYVSNKDFYYMATCNFQVSCNVDTTLIYAGGYSQDSGAPGHYYIGQEKLGSLDMKAYRPYYISYNFAYRGGYPSSTAAIQQMGLWMKNIVSGTIIYFLHSDMLIRGTTGDPYFINEGYPFYPGA